MAQGLTVAAVVAGGSAVAMLLGYLAFRMSFFGVRPTTIYAGIIFVIGLAMIPASLGVAAWLSFGYGWTVAGWILGTVGGVIALAVYFGVSFLFTAR